METSAKTDTAKEIKALYRKGMACMHLQEVITLFSKIFAF